MGLRFASLGSGSKGNGTLVEGGDTCLLIDCGFSLRDTERRLARLGRAPGDLSAILVTHEHVDHVRGVFSLARKYHLPVRMTPGTALASQPPQALSPTLIDVHHDFTVGALAVTPVAVPHDAREPVQFLLRHRGRTLGVLTDLGCITPHVAECYRRCDALLLEANHDPELLAGGTYPAFLKRRVGGDWGHLSNGQAAALLARIETGAMQSLVMAHISEQNNSPELVAEAIAPCTTGVGHVLHARQDAGFDWLGID